VKTAEADPLAEPTQPPRQEARAVAARIQAAQLEHPEEALAIGAEAVRRFPDSRALWRLHGKGLARAGRNADALHALKRALRLDPAAGATAREIAKILHAARRPRLALSFGARALDGGFRSPGLLADLAIDSLALHDPGRCLEYLAARAEIEPPTDLLASLRQRALAMQPHQAAAARRGDAPRVRHVAVGGHSYSGSTLLGALLGSLDGAAHGGETQELIYRTDARQERAVLIDFQTDEDAAIPQCRVCGPGCEVLTRPFRASLQNDPGNFYHSLGRRLGARTLVTSDKFITEYETKDPLSDFDLIVLYKPVLEWVRSYVRQVLRYRSDLPKEERLRRIQGWLDHWVMTYRGLTRNIRPQGRLIALNWQAFVDNPAAHFDRLTSLLGLAGGAEVFEAVRPGHYVGGNATSNVTAVMKAGRIDFKQSDAPPLPPDEEAFVTRYGPAREMFAGLEARYRTDFAGLPAHGGSSASRRSKRPARAAPAVRPPSVPPAELADRVNAELVALHRGRLEQLGPEASGLYEHYRHMVERQTLVAVRQKAAFELIERRLPAYDGYAVIRAGLGELALLLAASGRPVIAYEFDRYRAPAIDAGRAHLEAIGLLAPGALTLIGTAGPEAPLAGRILGVGLDSVSARDEAAAAPLMERSRFFEALLIDLRLYLRQREDSAEQAAAADALKVLGFGERQDFPAAQLSWFHRP
jgi:hypothetical protein